MKINKLVGSLAAMALLANLTASSVVLATEGVETPEVGKIVETHASETSSEQSDGHRLPFITHDPEVIAAFVEDLRSIREQLTAKQAAGYTSPDPDISVEEAIKYLDATIYGYLNITDNTLDSAENRAEIKQNFINFISSLVPPAGEQPEAPKPEQPKPQEPKPKEETPKAETPTDEVAPQPKAESNKPALPNTGDTEATAKPKDMTMEKPVSTTSATQSDNKQLPQTGEADSFAIFSAAALTILAGVGMLAYGKREEV